MLAATTQEYSSVILDGEDWHRPAPGGYGMSQLQITKQKRLASARRRDQVELPLPLDPRDPDIARAKRLQRRLRQPRGTSR